MVEVCFQICYTNRTISYTVPDGWSVDLFYENMCKKLRNDLNIKDFYILPGPGLQHEQYEGEPEEYPPVLSDPSETIKKYCQSNKTNTNLFYIYIK